MSQFKISLDLQPELHAEITDEAKQAGMDRAPYIRVLLEQRKDKEITIVGANENKLIARLEGKLEALGDQLADAHERLSQKTELAGINGVEKTQNFGAKQLTKELERMKAEWQADLDRKELEQLRLDTKAHKEKITALETEVSSHDRFSKTVDGLKETASTALSNPMVVSALAGLMGIKMPMQQAALGSTPEDERALTIGQGVINDIDPQIQPDVLLLLQLLSQHPETINQIIRLKPVSDYRKAAMAGNVAA